MPSPFGAGAGNTVLEVLETKTQCFRELGVAMMKMLHWCVKAVVRSKHSMWSVLLSLQVRAADS